MNHSIAAVLLSLRNYDMDRLTLLPWQFDRYRCLFKFLLQEGFRKFNVKWLLISITTFLFYQNKHNFQFSENINNKKNILYKLSTLHTSYLQIFFIFLIYEWACLICNIDFSHRLCVHVDYQRKQTVPWQGSIKIEKL